MLIILQLTFTTMMTQLARTYPKITFTIKICVATGALVTGAVTVYLVFKYLDMDNRLAKLGERVATCEESINISSQNIGQMKQAVSDHTEKIDSVWSLRLVNYTKNLWPFG